jgi:DNA-binding NtrC family response regulator
MLPLQVLIVGADVPCRRMLADALRAAGARVFETGDSRTAAESLRAAGFEAVVIDLGLPSLDRSRLSLALAPDAAVAPDSLDDAERRHIERTLRHTGGNRRQAALILGISRSTLLHKIRKYGLDGVRFTGEDGEGS